MISYHLNHSKRKFSKFGRFSKFLLIGNNVDGRVNVGTEVFQNYEEVKRKLPVIFRNLEFEGEWSLKLYQVPDNFSIHHQYGYYKVPSKGRLILDYSYMVAGDQIEISVSNTLIHISSISKSNDRYWQTKNGETENLNVYEEYVTVELIENIDGREIKNVEYSGDKNELFKDVFV